MHSKISANMEDYYCNVLADNVSDFFREKMIYEQRKNRYAYLDDRGWSDKS